MINWIVIQLNITNVSINTAQERGPWCHDFDRFEFLQDIASCGFLFKPIICGSMLMQNHKECKLLFTLEWQLLYGVEN